MNDKKILTKNILFVLTVVLAFLALIALTGLPWNTLQPNFTDQTIQNTHSQTSPLSTTQVQSQFTDPTSSTFEIAPTLGIENLEEASSSFSINRNLIISLPDEHHYHLFLLNLNTFSFIKLTDGLWDDTDPAISPDGNTLAFSSNRSGYWDIFLIDLQDGEIRQMTNTSPYDGSPTWSPDGLWLAYESYIDDNLEIFVQSVEEISSQPIRLTEDPSADFAPAWSPEGRLVAFISDRTGDMEVWMARLDTDTDRFSNASNNPAANDLYPSWSPDGKFLTWSSRQGGISNIQILDTLSYPQRTYQVGAGDHPVWDQAGTSIFTSISDPNDAQMGSYSFQDLSISIPFQKLPGNPDGYTWTDHEISSLLDAFQSDGSPFSFPPLWEPVLSIYPLPAGGLYGIVPLPGVQAPYPYLHDAVDESFEVLRQEIANQVGWNFLDTLENALIPITEPPAPEMIENWLYTGRAFAINPTAMYAGWMIIAREDYAGLTYWRIFLKARYQDGSQGRPLTSLPWDFTARYSGEPTLYETGGKQSAILSGYWVDFTNLALQYNWKRVPSLSTWRTYYSAMLFNQYVLNDGLNWQSAMSEIYPQEALSTATRIPTYTMTIVPTIEPSRTITPTPTITSTPTPTLLSSSNTPSIEPTITATPEP
jgi:TolB protein